MNAASGAYKPRYTRTSGAEPTGVVGFKRKDASTARRANSDGGALNAPSPRAEGPREDICGPNTINSVHQPRPYSSQIVSTYFRFKLIT